MIIINELLHYLFYKIIARDITIAAEFHSAVTIGVQFLHT